MVPDWDLAKKELQDNGDHLAVSLIGIPTFLDNVNFPESAFLQPIDAIPNQFQTLRDFGIQSKLSKARSALLQQNLLMKSTEEGMLILNPPMHTIVFESMNAADKQTSYDYAAYLLYLTFPTSPQAEEDMTTKWDDSNIYFPHVLSHLERAEKAEVLVSGYAPRMIMNAACYAGAIGQSNKLKYLLSKCLQACEKVDKVGTGLIKAEALTYGAWIHSQMGKLAPAESPQKAVQMAKDALKLRHDRLPDDHHLIAASYGTLAMLTLASEDYAESLKYSEACLRIRMLDEDNQIVSISTTHNYLAWCYTKLGDRAMSKFKALGAEGDQVDADALHQEATNYYAKAEASFKEAIGVFVRKYGDNAKDHSQIATPSYGLGNLYLSLGRELDAYRRHFDAYNLGLRMFGSTSPRSFVWVYKIGWYEYNRGFHEQAEAKMKILLSAMIRKGFYIGHIARAQHLLSLILECRGKTVESAEMQETALRNAQSLNGPEWTAENGLRDFDDLVFFHDR